MKHRLLSPLASTTLLILGISAAAPQLSAETTPPAEQLVELLAVRGQIERTAEELAPLVHQAADRVAADYPAGEQRTAHRNAVEKRLKEFVRDLVSWERLGPVYVAAYQEIYREEEIRELVDFLESPVGQRFLNEQPKLTAKVGETLQQLLPELMVGLEAEVAAFRREHPAEEGTHSCAACSGDADSAAKDNAAARGMEPDTQ